MADFANPHQPSPDEERSTPQTAETALQNVSGGRTPAAPQQSQGRFAIERMHAQGGLGRVSLAVDVQLKRPVAVKEIRPDRRTEEARRRFINEAEITGQLEHPGIVPIYALEENSHGEPYYAMRFIQGRPLSEAIAEYHARPSHLAFRELLQRFTSVCQTVAYAHSRGILHRDLKPSNIMLGEFGETLVVDWGLAKRMRPPDGQDRSFALSSAADVAASQESTVDSPGGDTRTVAGNPAASNDDAFVQTEMGQVLGTPAYMSPEQAGGRVDQVGAASDIYSLGAMFYVLLTGKTAIGGAGAAEQRANLLHGNFPAPRQTKGDVPPPLEAVCLKAMSLEPSGRYASAKELADDIEQWLADEPVSAYADPWPARAGRWLRKHRLLVGSAAVLLVTALVASVIGNVALEAERAETDDARRKADAALILANAEKAKAETALANQTRARQRTHAALNTLSDGMIERLLSRQTQIGPAERAYLRQIQGFYQEFAADTDTSETARAASADGHFRLAGIHSNLGEFREAGAGFLAAIDLYSKLTEECPQEIRYASSLAGCRNNFAFMLHGLGRTADAERECRTAIALREKLIDAEPKTSDYRVHLAGSHLNLGMILAAKGQRADEGAEYLKALELTERLVAEEPRHVTGRDHLARAHTNLGLTFKSQNKAADATRHFQRAIDVRKSLVADDSSPEERHNLAEAQARLANLHRERGNRAEAEPIYRESIAVHEKLAAEFPIVREYRIELAGNCSNLGGLTREHGQPEACLPWFGKSIELLEPMLAQEGELQAARKYLRVAYWGRALALDQLLRRDEALRDWDRAVELSSDEEKPQIQMPRAASLAGAGRHQEAIAEAQRLAEGATAGTSYDAACVHALASTAVKDDKDLQETYAARGIELLRQAKAGGLFDNPAMVAYVQKDNDLKSLREREDFKQFVSELERVAETGKK